AKKIVQDKRNKKKNTDGSAGFHLKQLNLSVFFYLLASFCPASLFYINKITQLEKKTVSKLMSIPSPPLFLSSD
ncbi:hypothetical protein K6V96_08550, partial [Streptococcus suis]|uniref:hypothetical protein n=1 Tax=Streptococcus suis TaxID=1307 RepID=UPI001C98BD2F